MPINSINSVKYNNNLHKQNREQKIIMNGLNIKKKATNSSQFDFCSPGLRRNGSTFITDKNITNNERQILRKHGELNGYIDVLDEKVQKIVENNEAEILFAYKNHLTKVKKQMEQFKEETLNHASKSETQQQTINALQKQLVIFREQSLKLFEKVVQKDKIIEKFKIRLDELESENRYMTDTFKSIKRKNNQLEMLSHNQKSQKQSEGANKNYKTNDPSYFASVANYTKKYYLPTENVKKQRPFTSSMNYQKRRTQTTYLGKTRTNFNQEYQNQGEESLFQKVRQRIPNCSGQMVTSIIEIIRQHQSTLQRKCTMLQQSLSKQITQSKKNRLAMRSKSGYTTQLGTDTNFGQIFSKCDMLEKSKSHAEKQNLLEIFKKSIETVKKQMIRRKGARSANFYKSSNPITLDQFKRVDFLKLMEMLFSNQIVTNKVFEAIFSRQEMQQQEFI